jgi:predicted O-linked N-acetylglucosamine transferase (SPINDLY family)
MKICDWADLDGRCQTLGGLLTANRASSPFAVLGLFDDPLLQQQCAELHAKSKFNFNNERRLITKEVRRDPKNKIRVGYFSADFHDHATMYLMAELFDYHDRGKFEVFGFSFGPKKDDAMRNRAQKRLDSFFDVANLSDQHVAALARAQQIDIAVDLKGYTQDSRPAIFGHGAAPIQINYLGFPGTMGTSAIDYLIADRVLIPDNLKSAYSEKIIYLPNSYQVNDSKRRISGRVFTRAELGLPESSFVYCCFNNNWKILPEIFGTWVRITQRVPNSVLWLYEDNPTAALNLKAQAKRQKLDPSRLVFARHLPHAEHLARYRLADLFLDTFPCTAHTTASDALWAGLPVLTRSGKSFASRVASSLLNAVGLPELITHTAEEYESLAINLAKNSGKISSLKTKLANNRATCPLFNTALFTQHIESAYQAVHERYHGGLAPEHIYVS